ncbi:MAG: SspB family protein [Methylocella sp.]
MAVDLMRYDLLVQDALRGVVRKVLGDMARDGLVGEHHFYITFRTHARGVRLSSRMRELYPDEMTIILQHQFWDLSVSDHAFEVGLSFKNVPEMLLIPFDAITRFSDPAAGFDLEFKLDVETAEAGANDAGSPTIAGSADLSSRLAAIDAAKPHGAGGKAVADSAARDGAEDRVSDDAKDKIVSIDAFRKKT